VTEVDLSGAKDPFDTLNSTLKTIVTTKLVPAYDKEQNNHLVFYFTGHGFADEQMRSQILLNMPIAKFATKNFQNPYEIERVLGVIFNGFYNVSIELVVDACREKNEFKAKFEAKGIEIPTVPIAETKFDFISGKILSGGGEEQRRTADPWAGKPAVNNIFVRNYACEYARFADATPKVCYADRYADRFEELLDEYGFVLMPNHFLTSSGFVYKNEKSGSVSECTVTYRMGDQMPAKNKRTQICLMPKEKENKQAIEELKKENAKLK
jgi:hypothetical protein